MACCVQPTQGRVEAPFGFGAKKKKGAERVELRQGQACRLRGDCIINVVGGWGGGGIVDGRVWKEGKGGVLVLFVMGKMWG